MAAHGCVSLIDAAVLGQRAVFRIQSKTFTVHRGTARLNLPVV
jgi:hypothetical protein